MCIRDRSGSALFEDYTTNPRIVHYLLSEIFFRRVSGGSFFHKAMNMEELNSCENCLLCSWVVFRFSLLVPGNRADYYVFRGNSRFSCNYVFNLCSLGICKAGCIDYHVHAGAADAHYHVVKAFGFQKDFSCGFFFSHVSKGYHAVDGVLLLFFTDVCIVYDVKKCFFIFCSGLFLLQLGSGKGGNSCRACKYGFSVIEQDWRRVWVKSFNPFMDKNYL